jgi:hypothetical protein
MTANHLLADRDGTQIGRDLQHRHDLALPYAGERVGTAAAARLLFLRRQPRIGFDPIRGGGGKPRLRSGDGRPLV